MSGQQTKKPSWLKQLLRKLYSLACYFRSS